MVDPVAFVLRGLPGSGKSTIAAAWCAKDPLRRRIVNRDQIRFDLFGRYSGLTAERESTVTDLEFGLADNALSAGLSVVVDATNLAAEHRLKWTTFFGARSRVVTIGTPLSECLRRNRVRGAAGGRLVPEDVICRMHAAAVLS